MIANKDLAAELERVIQRYNEAWNAHDLVVIVSHRNTMRRGDLVADARVCLECRSCWARWLGYRCGTGGLGAPGVVAAGGR